MAFVDQPTNRRNGLLGGVVLALVAAIGLAVVLLSGDGKSNDRSPTKERPQQATGESTTLKAEDVTYSDVYGAQVPSSPAGPKNTSGGRAIGFDHSPAGAVLAAVNIFARVESRPGPSVFEPTIQEQVIGPDKDKLLAKAQADYSAGATRGTSPDGALSVAIGEARPNRVGLWAYRVETYDNASASVNILLRQLVPGTSSYAYFNFPFVVRWIDGDWRLVAPLNGEFGSVIQRVAEVPTNYVVVGKD